MKITRNREATLGPRKLQFTPTRVRALPELPASRARKTLLEVGLFVGEIHLMGKLSLRTSEVPTSLHFSSSQTLVLPDLEQRVSSKKLVEVVLFVGKIELQQALFLAESPSQNKTGPRTISFTRAHELPLPSF